MYGGSMQLSYYKFYEYLINTNDISELLSGIFLFVILVALYGFFISKRPFVIHSN